MSSLAMAHGGAIVTSIIGRRSASVRRCATAAAFSTSAAAPYSSLLSQNCFGAVRNPTNNCPLNHNRLHTSASRTLARLAEVGKLELPKADNYDTGQMFLHRLFGYRGVILFCRSVPVSNRDEFAENAKDKKLSSENAQKPPPGETDPSKNPQDMSGTRHTYYMVLIDSRDCSVVTHRESVTYLGNHSENNTRLYSVPGLDYVAHEDILPYSTDDRSPIQHELFHKFLQYRDTADPPWGAQDALLTWQEKRHPWLELNMVNRETTNGIRVTAVSYYMGCKENQQGKKYWWRYCILMENLGELTVQLRERHWKIFASDGFLETVRGRGVVGQEPVLSTRQPAFQYSAHVSLNAPAGNMWGHLKFEGPDGTTFEVKIPAFSLDSKYSVDPDTGDIGPPDEA